MENLSYEDFLKLCEYERTKTKTEYRSGGGKDGVMQKLETMVKELESKDYDQVWLVAHGLWDDEDKKYSGYIKVGGGQVREQTVLDDIMKVWESANLAACYYSDPKKTHQVGGCTIEAKLERSYCRISLTPATFKLEISNRVGYP